MKQTQCDTTYLLSLFVPYNVFLLWLTKSFASLITSQGLFEEILVSNRDTILCLFTNLCMQDEFAAIDLPLKVRHSLDAKRISVLTNTFIPLARFLKNQCNKSSSMQSNFNFFSWDTALQPAISHVLQHRFIFKPYGQWCSGNFLQLS